jgi:hypothetical protein
LKHFINSSDIYIGDVIKMKKFVSTIMITLSLISISAFGTFDDSLENGSQAGGDKVAGNSVDSKEGTVSEAGSKQMDSVQQEKVMKEEGVFVGRIDTHSIEIDMSSGIKAFQIEEDVSKIKEGSKVEVQYVKNEHGQNLLLSIIEK